MTLKTLAKSINIQGNIRISVWDDMEEEIEVYELHYVDDLSTHLNQKQLQHLRNLEVTFLFAPEDGFLHIELKTTGKLSVQ